ncbi:MAG: GTP-binding protein, partial [Pseudomonadota bacterium]
AGQFSADDARLAAQRAADESLDHETPLSELFADQLACADMVVVSKSDALSGAELAGLEGSLAERVRNGVTLVRSTAAGLAPDLVLGLGVGAEDDLEGRAEVHHHHHHHDDHDHHHGHDHHHDHDQDHDHHHHDDHGHDAFESFALNLGELPDPAAFQAALAEVIAQHNILRLKGFAAIQGKPMRQVIQAVGPRIESYFDRPFGAEPREARLVVIGLQGLDRAGIEAKLTAAASPAVAAQ